MATGRPQESLRRQRRPATKLETTEPLKRSMAVEAKPPDDRISQDQLN